MSNLHDQPCESCRADAPCLSDADWQLLACQIPDWEMIEIEGVKQLRRIYSFKTFMEALSFANAIGELAEEEVHHPALLVEWGKLTVRWWTHKIGGVHKNDVIMAAKTDHLFELIFSN